MNYDIKRKTIDLIDELKSICQTYGMGNDGNEYKIITQIFLYKFLNDKFGYELKKAEPKFINDQKNWEQIYSEMSKEDREEVWDLLGSKVPIFEPEDLISNLWNQKEKEDFSFIFDNAMINVSQKNDDIFSTHTVNNTNIPLFEKITQYVTDENQRSAFARALISKLPEFSFEDAFSEFYDFFADIFEYLIMDYNTDGGGKYAEYYTPQSIAKIMAKLLVGDKKDYTSIDIYDPSAGTGTLVIALAHQIGEDRCNVFAQDISQKSNKMLKLNLILNNMVLSIDNVVQGDTLTDPYHRDEEGNLKQFDFVVSNPPFKMDFSDTREKLSNMTSRFWAGVPSVPKTKKSSMSIYTLFIQHVINSLKNGKGKGAIVVPSGFITSQNGIENRILKKIVDEKIVYGCISMPSNVFANTGTNVSVLFFDKSQSHDKVILIDASKLGEDFNDGKNKRRRLRNEDIDLIINTFNKKENIEDFSIAVDYEEIKEKNYSLSAGQYFEIKIDYVDITDEEFNEKIKNTSEWC